MQTDPAAAGPVDAVSAISTPSEPARWFSCVAGRNSAPGELISGRFWIDRDSAAGSPDSAAPLGGVVRWTIDVGSDASPDVTYQTAFENSVDTDAWIPGNGCRNSAGAWRSSADIEFDDDGLATAESIAAFNDSIAADDPSRRVVRLRGALGVAASLRGASGPYREDVAEGFFEVGGVPDDSTGALRWDFVFSDDGAMLESVVFTWACAPGRGHEDFSRESCV